MTKFDPKFADNKMWRIGEGRYIKNCDIPQYFTEGFYQAMEAWQLTKVWGLANGNIGWANEPKSYIEAITILESESNKVQIEEMEAKRKNNKVGDPDARKK